MSNIGNHSCSLLDLQLFQRKIDLRLKRLANANVKFNCLLMSHLRIINVPNYVTKMLILDKVRNSSTLSSEAIATNYSTKTERGHCNAQLKKAYI